MFCCKISSSSYHRSVFPFINKGCLDAVINNSFIVNFAQQIVDEDEEEVDTCPEVICAGI